MKIGALCFVAMAICLTGLTAVAAETPSTVVSQWHVTAWIGQTIVDDTLTLRTTGEKVVGEFHGNAITGTLVNEGAQLNGNWTGPRGSGWITLHFHNDGNGFSGTWGQKGKPADGQFVGGRLTPSPTPAAQ
jgi:hypothetical protein